jgi:hypothetical protein
LQQCQIASQEFHSKISRNDKNKILKSINKGKKMKKITVFSILLILLTMLFAKSNEVYFQFELPEKDQLNQLSRIISIDKIENNQVYAYANQEELSNFQKTNISHTILPHPNTLHQVTTSDDFDDVRSWTAYPTYEAYVSAMYQFETDYPNLCDVFSIGQSVNGREILFAKITQNVSVSAPKPQFQYTGQMHGDETVTYILLLNLIEYLLQNYSTDSYVANLVDNIEIWINPLSNPDGTYAGGNHTVQNATRYNANSRDLNRNYPDMLDGNHPDGYAWQPETVAMLNIADANHFVMSANLHSGAVVVNYPWDRISTRHADDDWYQYVSNIYASQAQIDSPGFSTYFTGFNNGITNGYDWYSVNGGRQDYMNYFQNCREVTLELSSTKLLPENQLANYWNYNKNALMYYMEQVMYGINGTITDEFGAPLVATVEIVGHDSHNSHVFSRAAFGDYYRPIYAGTYNVKFSAAGYDDIIIENVVVQQNQTTILHVQFGVEAVTQQFAFSSGWDLISLAVHPDNMTPASLFSPILDDVLQIKNLTQTFDPSVPEFLNTLTELNDGYAYWIHLDNAANLSLTAPAVDVNSTTIQLQSGWNLIGYPIIQSQNVETALAAIQAELLQVKSLTQSYDPTLPEFLNTLTHLEAGKGYWMQVSDACSFTYPSAKNEVIVSAKDDAIWQPVIYPNNSAVVYAVIELGDISENDVLAAFVGDECRSVSYPVFFEGNFYATFVLQLAEQNEQIHFKLHQNSNGQILNSDSTLSLSFGETVGTAPDALFPLSFPLTGNDTDVVAAKPKLSNYPNPFNPSTTIQFSNELFEQNELLTLEIYNLKGQKIRQFNIHNSTLNINEVVWDGKNEQNEAVSSGIYFYQVTAGKYKIREKMLLLK